jgi:hypothetical protein
MTISHLLLSLDPGLLPKNADFRGAKSRDVLKIPSRGKFELLWTKVLTNGTGDDTGPAMFGLPHTAPMHVSTASLHMAALEEAGPIATELRPARRGTQKVCTRLHGNMDCNCPRTATSRRPTRR